MGAGPAGVRRDLDAGGLSHRGGALAPIGGVRVRKPKTAKAIDMRIPLSLQLRAQEVIQWSDAGT